MAYYNRRMIFIGIKRYMSLNSSQFSAILCPEIENGDLQGCDRHHMHTCQVNCAIGYSTSSSSILCDLGHWDVANPCKESKSFNWKLVPVQTLGILVEWIRKRISLFYRKIDPLQT